jgi:hypothetical protein
MTDTDQLVVWLREALGAAQADAEAATPGPWHVTEYDWQTDFDAGVGTSLGEVDVVGHGYEGGGVERVEDARHIVRHAPAAVLRRIAADRQLLDLHRNDNGDCAVCADPLESSDDVEGNREWSRSAQYFPCATVRLLAEGWGWTDTRSTANWPECMCTPSGECGNCWEKRQGAPTPRSIAARTRQAAEQAKTEETR